MSKARQISRRTGKAKITGLDNNNYYSTKYYARVEDIDYILSQSKIDKFLGLFPKTYQEIRLNKLRVFKSQDLQKEIQWQYLIVKKYADCIKEYLDKKNTFEYNFFLGDYKKAMATLDNIEKDICISDWSTEMKILTAYYGMNYDEFKEFSTKELFPKFKPMHNEHFFAYLNSLRIENELPVVRFEKEFNKHIELFKEKMPSYVDYYYYKVNFFNYIGCYDNVKLLQLEDITSIIDRYETLIFVIQSVFCKDDNNVTPEWLKDIIKNLYSLTNEERLKNLLFYIGKLENINISEKDNEYCSLIDIYASQKFDKSMQVAKELLLKYPNIFDYYKIYALSCIYSKTNFENVFNQGTIAYKALNSIYEVLNKSIETNKSLNILQNLYTSLGKMSWAFKCCAFVHNETSLYTENFKYRLFSYINDSILYPRIIRYIKSKDTLQSIVNSHLYKINENIKFLTYNQIKCLNIGGINTEYISTNSFREKIIYAQVLKLLKKYELANDKFDEIFSDNSVQEILKTPHNEVKLVHGKMRCLVELGRYNEALTLVCKYTLKNPIYLTKLKYEALIEAVTNSSDANVRANIYTPIYLNLFRVKEICQWGALANFMTANNITKPQNLLSIKDANNIEELKYILKNICIESVICWGEYSDKSKLIEECVSIKNKLMEFDHENKITYEEQIYKLEIKKNVNSTKYYVNSGKLKVNIKGIKNDIKFQILKKTVEELINIAKKENVPDRKIHDKIYLGKNIKETILFQNFNRIFEDVRDIFVLDNDYGFDLYLGTRIRHGNMQNAIRTVFENHSLITVIDSKSSKYQKNTAWEPLSNDTVFQKIMSDFSLTIDKLISDLNGKILRIKIDEDSQSEALFDYVFNNEELKMLCNTFVASENLTFEAFFNTVINALWERTNQNLERVRGFLLNDIQEKINAAVEILQAKLKQNYKKQQYKNIEKSILEANTDCQKQIVEITKWFYIEETDKNPFNIDNLIEACHSSFYKQMKIQINNKSNKLIIGKYLKPFADMFHILLTNIVNHSGLSLNEIDAKINIEEINDSCIISASNNLAQNIDIQSINTRLETKILPYLDNLSQQENHSGLSRIHKLVTKDMDMPDAKIDIPLITAEREFKVIITVNKNRVYYENTNN